MTKPSAIKRLEEYRLEVLWWEMCSILHDIGKFSSDFHEYRQNWWTMADGWSARDPHDHEWFKKDRELPAPLRAFFAAPVPNVKTRDSSWELSVLAAVHGHTDRRTKNRLVQLLMLGDGTDSRWDRNCPLISNEQTSWDGEIHSPYRGNVYGYETRVELRELDSARATFYAKLWEILGKYAAGGTGLTASDYFLFKDLCAQWFEPAMSDTTRPSNDTSLWEHVYGVSCISKAAHAEDIGNQLAAAPPWPYEFALFGVGLDTWRWSAQGHKIGDVRGRKQIVEDCLRQVKQWMEFEVGVGNCIYEDDSYQVYLIGRLAPLQAVGEWLKAGVLEKFEEVSQRELGAATYLLEEAQSTTAVVKVIEELRKRIAAPSNWQPRTWVADGAPDSDICPVCRTRRTGRRQGANAGICGTCRRRRSAAPGRGEDGETAMLGEIADGNGRVALVLARFGLRDWLSGQMTRTCLITEADGAERLGRVLERVEELKGEAAGYQEWLKAAGAGYDALRGELEALRTGAKADSYGLALLARSPAGAPLRLRVGLEAARETWNRDLTEFARDCEWLGETWMNETERLLNAISAKTPTPSTTLDVWTTTREFFESSVKGEEAWLRRCLRQGRRRWLSIDRVPEWLKYSQRRAVEVEGFGDEFLYEDGRLWITQTRGRQPGTGETITLIGDTETERTEGIRVTGESNGREEKAYWPYRTLTVSPDVLMVLVPGDRAPEFTEMLAERYREQFGKVDGRLPLGIANIFFPQHLPMFSVLDTAWRVMDNFRRLQEGPWVERPYRRPASGEGLLLGNCERDPFHAHVITKERAAVRSAFLTAGGWIAHRDEVAEKTAILARPNVYDGIVLGGSGDRLNLNLTNDLACGQAPETRAVVAEGQADERLFARPGEQRVGLMTLEDFRECRRIWKALGDTGVGDRALRNLWFAMESRRQAWGRAGGEDELRGIGAALGEHYLGEVDWGRFREAFEKGLLEKTLQLHWAILKERLEE